MTDQDLIAAFLAKREPTVVACDVPREYDGKDWLIDAYKRGYRAEFIDGLV